jgi:hypothetical protein
MAIAIRGTTPATTITVSNPVSVSLTGARQPNSGDVLVIIHCNDFYALSNMPTPSVGGSTSGVTAIVDADSGASEAHARSYYKVVSATGDLTVSVTETSAGDEEKALIVYVLSGVDTGTPVDVSGSAVDTGTTTQICPSVSPTSSDAYLICHTNPGPFSTTTSYTPPSGMTETYDAVAGMNIAGAIEQLAASGATGTRTFVPNVATVANQAMLSIAVKTAATAAADSSSYSRAVMPGVINPDGLVYLPGVRYDDISTATPIAVTADVATLTLTGVDPTLVGSGAATTTADVATLTFAGTDPALAGSGVVSVTADVATLTFTGVDVTVSAGTTVAADPAVLALTGVDPVLAGSGATSVTADVAALTFTGITPTISGAGAASVTADVATLTFAGVDVTASSGPSVTADTAVLTLTGITPTLTATGAAAIAADVATLTLTGITPTLAGTGAVTRTADVAVLTFTGVEVSGFSGQLVTPASRTYTVPADPRTLTVDADVRTWTIPADPRTLTVPTIE